ncbi:hypothetical protein ACU4GD_18845 [Cupriavidus basilensis]
MAALRFRGERHRRDRLLQRRRGAGRVHGCRAGGRGRADAASASRAYRLGVARFESYFASGEGGYDDADPHIYSMLCHNLATRLEGAANRAERIALHEKGIAVSEFIEHWIDLLECLEAAGQHQKAVEVAGDVLNRYPLERDPANVGWIFSRLMSTWKAIGGAEVTSAARDALGAYGCPRRCPASGRAQPGRARAGARPRPLRRAAAQCHRRHGPA